MDWFPIKENNTDLKIETLAASALRKSPDSAVIEKTVPIKNDFLDALFKCPFGDQFPDDFGAFSVSRFPFQFVAMVL
jgi:hypothetical protein